MRALIPATLILTTGLTACGTPSFKDSFNNPEIMKSAMSQCQAQASSEADRGEYEGYSDSAAGEVGAELGHAIAESVRYRKALKACMKAQGYVAK